MKQLLLLSIIITAGLFMTGCPEPNCCVRYEENRERDYVTCIYCDGTGIQYYYSQYYPNGYTTGPCEKCLGTGKLYY